VTETNREPLTRRQREVFEVYLRAQGGMRPTIRSVALSLGLQVGTVHQHVSELVRKGYLARITGGKHTQIVVGVI
jgi:DNA-binding NarL/FixJ family response regulator